MAIRTTNPTRKKAARKKAQPKRIIDKITASRKKGAWFMKLRGSYLPVSWQGWLSYVPFTILAVLPLKTLYLAWIDCDQGTNVFCSNDPVAIVGLRVIAAAIIYYAILVCAMTIFAQRKS